MSVKQHLVTAEELLEMPDIPGKQVELVNGKVVEMSPAGGVHTRIMFRLAQRLDAFVGQNDLGEVMPDIALGMYFGAIRIRSGFQMCHSSPQRRSHLKGFQQVSGKVLLPSPSRLSRRTTGQSTSAPRYRTTWRRAHGRYGCSGQTSAR